MVSAHRCSTGRWTTRRSALGTSELLTSVAAAYVSTSAYRGRGPAYLAPGVAGDLVGFAVLSWVLRTRDARLRHEAALCLACIGALTAATGRTGVPHVPEPVLWGVFAAGLSAYLRARRRTCR
jgi:hypothetical protein